MFRPRFRMTHVQTPKSRSAFLQRAGLLAAIMVCAVFAYGTTLGAYFCSDDDFLERHRTAFEDARSPERMFTTAHFDSFKYRPLNRVLNLLTYKLDDGAGTAFRIRNLLFHLLNIALLYALLLRLGKPLAAAAAAALLFAVHPLAHQNVIGAVNTNTAGFMLALLSLLVFAAGVHRPRGSGRAVVISVLIASGAVLFYETNIVVFGILCAWIIYVRIIAPKEPVRRALVRLAVPSLICLGLYFGARAAAVPAGYGKAAARVPAVAAVAANVAIYGGAILSPVDPVLANEWFGTPLPSDPAFRAGWFGRAVAASALVSALFLAALVVWLLRRGRAKHRWASDGFLAVCALLPLAPVLVFTDHPSETYVYPTVAFACGLSASLLFDWCSGTFKRRAGIVFAAVISVMAIACLPATIARSRRVAACGQTAQKVLSSIPFNRFAAGGNLMFADAPGGPPFRRYGFYNYTGLYTVTNFDNERSRGMNKAVQVASGNERLSARVVDGAAMRAFARGCAAPDKAAFWVDSAGDVTEQAAAKCEP